MTAIIPTTSLQQTSLGRRLLARAVGLSQRLVSDPVLQKSALSVFDQAVVSGTAFATSILLGWCGKSELGLYYLAWSLIGLIRGIQEQLVIAPYMIYCGRKQGAEIERYAGSSLVHEICYLSLAAGILATLRAFGLIEGRLGDLLGLLAVVLPVVLLRDYIRQISFAHLETKVALAVDLFVAGTQLSLLLALGLLGWLSVDLGYVVMAVSCGLVCLVWLFQKKRAYRATATSAWSDWRQNWQFSKWALVTHLLACTSPYFMPWVVAIAKGEAETGTFGACASIVGFANMFMMGLCNYFGPRAAHAYAAGGINELKKTLAKSATCYTVSLGAITIGAFFAGEMLTVLCYGQAFQGTGLIVGIMTLAVLANGLTITAGNGLWAMEKPSANFWADLCSLMVTIVATILLVPQFATLGAAIAALLGIVADGIVRWWTLWRLLAATETTPLAEVAS